VAEVDERAGASGGQLETNIIYVLKSVFVRV